ncbi:MAG: DPP IV N-terminal domain-containing protein, partial [Pyrinomonadaceae bacterium]
APDELERIVTKALAKDREERYQTVKDMLIDLRRLKRRVDIESELGRPVSLQWNSGDATLAIGRERVLTPNADRPTDGAPTRTGILAATRRTLSGEYVTGKIRRHKTGATIALAVLIAALGGVALGLYQSLTGPRRGADTVASFQTMRMARLTTHGKASDAAVSPDGKYVAYVLDEAGRQSVWVKMVASATSNVQVVPPAEANYWGLRFSRDGNYLYYVTAGKEVPVPTLYQMPVLGGPSRRIISNVNSGVALSPDGARLAFVRSDFPSEGETALMIANADGGGERVLAGRKAPDFFPFWGGPAWSPDGKKIACAAGSFAGGYHIRIVAVSVEDGKEEPVTSEKWQEMGRLGWTGDGGGLVVAAADRIFSSLQLWHVSYPSGAARKITNDLNNYRDVSLTADGSALAIVQSTQVSNVWVTPPGADGATVEAARAAQITSGGSNNDGLNGIAWTPDGRVVYGSNASGNRDIWMVESDGSDQRQLTTNAGTNLSVTVSPDGRYVVFTSDRAGSPHIWRMNIDGGDPVRLTGGAGEEHANCSPDGRWVAYTSIASGKQTLWKVPIDGGEAVQLTNRDAERPVFSPDGKFIACRYHEEPNAPWRIAVIPAEGGEPVRTFDFPPTFNRFGGAQWTSDGRALLYVDTRGGVSNIWKQPADGGSPVQ